MTLKTHVEQLSNKYQADIYFYIGGISREAAEFLINKCQEKYNENAVLILYTLGGDADASYIIVKYFQRKYKRLTLIINGVCKSAGSLIALGADAIVMGPNGELGPLDVQQRTHDEIGGLTSGLNIPSALNKLTSYALTAFRECLLTIRAGSGGQVKTKTAADIAVNFSIGLYSKIFEKIDPNTLGEIERAIKVAHNYALRIQRGNLQDNCVEDLIYNYPSHSFVIDYDEAKNLFKTVNMFEKEESDFFNKFPDFINDLDERGFFYPQKETTDRTHIANMNEVYYAKEPTYNTQGIYEDSDNGGQTATSKRNGGVKQSVQAKKREPESTVAEQ